MNGSAAVAAWRARGRTVPVRGHEIFVVDEGHGPSAAVVLHGFPTSGYDFSAVLPELAASRRVIVADMPGFGLSSKPVAYRYSLEDQLDVLLELWQRLGVRSAHVLAHDMGTSVACALFARRESDALPIDLRSAVLCNGSVFVEMARLTPSQKLLRSKRWGPLFASLGSRAVFGLQMRRIFGRATAVPSSELDAMWELLCERDGRLRLPAIIRYIDERYEQASRWLAPLGRLDLPVLVLWGERDPVSVVAIGERLAREIPGASMVRLTGVGHYPMVEDPARFASAVLDFWRRVEKSS
jgi:pimeloyl-ACP methyl ester carboxylesterase